MRGKPLAATQKDEFRVGTLRFDPVSGELRRGDTLRLELKAAAVLGELCRARGEVVSRSHLLDVCWGDGEGSDESLTQAVSQIRKAIEALGDSPGLIETLAKRGYRLKVAPLSSRFPEEGAPTPDTAPTLRLPVAALAAGVLAMVTALMLLGWWIAPHDVRHALRHGGEKAPSRVGSH